ncbi:MAG TPA: large conductance mechanosensitive channel protein MscL [Streptosporangiaceae bacterium]|nr:large conductance mechanosensitive channel protein MscL [Streptosporangiaceae bacterium]
MKGFKTFLLRGNLVDLAVAVVIGVAFNAVVQSLVKYLITPLVASVAGKPDFGTLAFHINKATFSYGLVLNSLISFLIMATLIYFVIVAPMSKLLSLAQRNKEATEQTCPECLSLIPAKATRCKFCTALVPADGHTANNRQHQVTGEGRLLR